MFDKLEEIGKAIDRFNDVAIIWFSRLFTLFVFALAAPFALSLLYIVYGFFFLAIFDPESLRPKPEVQQTQAEVAPNPNGG